MTARAALAAAVLLALAPRTARAQAIQERAERPPPLERAPACEIWKGLVSGNDPTVEAEVRLCAGPNDTVVGVFQWSSLRSGWNRRELAGQWKNGGTALEMHDVRVAEERPQPGWRFCTVDRYALTRTGDALEGTYRLAKCNDTAKVSLRLVPPPPPAATPAPPPEAPAPAAPAVPPAAAPAPAPTRAKRFGACALTSTATDPEPGAWAFAAGLVAIALAAIRLRRSE